MRRGVLGTAAALAVLTSCTGSPRPSPSPAASRLPTEAELQKPLPSPLPEVAAEVNGRRLPMRIVGAEVASAAMRLHDLTSEKVAALYRAKLLQLVDRELLFQEALARGLTADDKLVEQSYNTTRLAYPDDEKWNAHLAEQGIDDATFRAQLRVRATADALVREEMAKLPDSVSDAAARAAYEAHPDDFSTGPRYRAAHILVKAPRDMAPTVRSVREQKARQIFVRLQKGADFAAVARELSEDAATAGSGGELPVFAGVQLEAPLQQVLAQMRPGEISSVVQSSSGFHIFKLFEVLPSEPLDFDKYREDVKQLIVQRKHQDALAQLLASLRARARIETYL